MVSIREFLVNAAIIISIIYISSLIHKQFLMNIKNREKDICFIFIAIFAGWSSMLFGIRLTDSVIFDLRFVPIIIATLHFRNPINILVIGVGIGLLRFSFGFSSAAAIGFINVILLSFTGVLLFYGTSKWGKVKRMVFTVILLNILNIVITLGLGVISTKDYLTLILPTILPANILLSLLLLWIVSDLKGEYFHKIELLKKVNKDPLTKVFNRRGLMYYYKQLAFNNPDVLPLSIAFLDLDHFKKVNDEYGHLVGDLVLKEVSRLVSENIRNIDIIGRFGGEEFVVILPNCKTDEAIKVMERVRQKVASTPFTISDFTINITLSIGIASTENILPNHLLNAADEAVYLAKEKGRNIVLYAENVN